MTFIFSALILCILAVHNFEAGRYLIGALCLLCSAFLPVFLQNYHDHLNQRPSCHHPAPLAPLAPDELSTEAVKPIDKMRSDLAEIRADLRLMTQQAQEIRMCIVPDQP